MGRILKIIICIAFVVTGCKHTAKNNSKLENEYSIQKDTQEWVGVMIEGYRNFNKNRSIKAADQIFKATELMPKKNLENYIVAAMVYVANHKNEKALSSIERAIDEGFKDSELLNSLPEFSSLQNNPRWKNIIERINLKSKESLKSIQNIEVLEELQIMYNEDQQALSAYEKNVSNLDSNAKAEEYQNLFKQVENRWEINKNKLDSIVKIYGWPGYKLVGEHGAKLAWAIPQHYPDVFYKETCLGLIGQSIKKGDTDPNYYAELNDRIARETWRKQTYGASMGETSPYPIKEPQDVNKRRSELGLIEPIEVHAIYHGIEYNVLTKLEAQKNLRDSYENAQADYKKFEDFVELKKGDSANIYLSKAINAHGDISDEQLFRASIKLAQLNNEVSSRMSLKILRVLIWRRWKNRHQIVNSKGLNTLHNQQEWINIRELLERSK